MQQVSRALQQAGGANAAHATRAVLGVLARHVGEGEARHLREMFPKDLLVLWPQETT